MARRKRRVRPLAAQRRQQLRDALPPGVSLDDIGDLCRGLDRTGVLFGCQDGEHSLAATIDYLLHGDLYTVRDDMLIWLAEVGGVCDCTIQSRALRRVLRLSQDLWEEA